MKILNIYSSLNGPTARVAAEISKAAKDMGCELTEVQITKDTEALDLLDFDLSFFGSGVYSWLPPKPALKWIDKQMDAAKAAGLIKPCSPRIPSKFVSVYTTFGGPHTGVAEAVPAVKYMGQLFDHLGISITDEWYVQGSFIPENFSAMNTAGRMGNVEGRPNATDLRAAYERTCGTILNLRPVIDALP